MAERAQVQATSAKDQAVTASKLPDLRNNEAAVAAALQRLTIARNQIDEDVARIETRKQELENRIAQLQTDIEREKQAGNDHATMLKNLDTEEADLTQKSRNSQTKRRRHQTRFKRSLNKIRRKRRLVQ